MVLDFPKEAGWSHHLFSLPRARRWYVPVSTLYSKLLAPPHLRGEETEAQRLSSVGRTTQLGSGCAVSPGNGGRLW